MDEFRRYKRPSTPPRNRRQDNRDDEINDQYRQTLNERINRIEEQNLRRHG